jgi:hypothetical protein
MYWNLDKHGFLGWWSIGLQELWEQNGGRKARDSRVSMQVLNEYVIFYW